VRGALPPKNKREVFRIDERWLDVILPWMSGPKKERCPDLCLKEVEWEFDLDIKSYNLDIKL